MTAEGSPKTQLEAIRFFSDPQTSHDFFVGIRWANGVECPHCKRNGVTSKEVSFYVYGERRLWRCQTCKKQFTAKVGSIFEDSPLPLEKWLPCLWIIVNAKNGVSSCEIARSLGVTQKTAWFMLHRIRAALKVSSFEKLRGTVETDETFIGGAAKNMHKGKREARGIKRGGAGKAIVMGVLKRATRKGHSKVRAMVIANTDKESIHGEIKRHVAKGTKVFTDCLLAYQGLTEEAFNHRVVDHAVEYVNGAVHTNGLENFWCLLKRTIKGTYVAVNPNHLDSFWTSRLGAITSGNSLTASGSP